ncbi:hypothetical protein EDD11_006611 [Mortierella claussenii]|nr:hypothetical protein EDD11_006611 [Mortierella claussenii]
MSNFQEINNSYFNKKAKEYDSFPQAEEMTVLASKSILDEFTASTSEERVKAATALDFGCGTGLCAFKIAPYVSKILGVDASEGMLNHLAHKLATQEVHAAIRDKIKTVHHLVTVDTPLPEPEYTQYVSGPAPDAAGFDLVYSSYVMHHIDGVQSVVDVLAQKLVKKDGWLILVDFESGHYPQGGASGGGHGHGHEYLPHQHQHQHDEKQHLPQDGVQNVHDFFKDENGSVVEHVAHKDGFGAEEFEVMFRQAGLVDVSAKRAYGLHLRHTFHGAEAWVNFLVVKGRRA